MIHKEPRGRRHAVKGGLEAWKTARYLGCKITHQDFVPYRCVQMRSHRSFRNRFERRRLQRHAAPNSRLSAGAGTKDHRRGRRAAVLSGQFKATAQPKHARFHVDRHRFSAPQRVHLACRANSVPRLGERLKRPAPAAIATACRKSGTAPVRRERLSRSHCMPTSRLSAL